MDNKDFGIIFGIFLILASAGNLIGSIVNKIQGEGTEPKIVFFSFGFMILGMLLIYRFVRKKKDKTEEKENGNR